MSGLECVLAGNVTDENRWTMESDAKAMMTRLGIDDFEQPAGQLFRRAEKASGFDFRIAFTCGHPAVG